jgi:hypothetical protein
MFDKLTIAARASTPKVVDCNFSEIDSTQSRAYFLASRC